MQSEIRENLLIALLRWASDDTFNYLYGIIRNQGAPPTTFINSNIRRIVLSAYISDANRTYMHSARAKIANYLDYICQLSQLFNCFEVLNIGEFNEKSIKNIEKLIKLNYEHENIFYWEFCNKAFILHDFSSTLFKQIDFSWKRSGKTIHIEQDNYHTYLININKVKLENIRKLSKNCKFNRFLSEYEALSKALVKSENLYCPWCNPNDKIEHSMRQRKCEDCSKIEEFLLKTGKYKSKNLNMTITRLKEKNELKFTIKKRGNFLLTQVNSIKNLNCDEKLITQVKNIIKSRYQLDT